jgi:hypothetical protein
MAWYIADIAEARGRQKLYTRQVPQRLKALREHALIESAVSSNRIEGIEIDQKRRLDITRSPRGAKTELVEAAIKFLPDEFTLSDIERACPGVSHDMVRKILRLKKQAGEVECLGRGPGARWKKRGNTLKRG